LICCVLVQFKDVTVTVDDSHVLNFLLLSRITNIVYSVLIFFRTYFMFLYVLIEDALVKWLAFPPRNSMVARTNPDCGADA
jgi:hypothetical protein